MVGSTVELVHEIDYSQTMRPSLLFLVTLAAQAQALPDPTDVLARARDIVLSRIDRLPNYTCVQTINRNYFRTSSEPASCDKMIGERIKKASKQQLEATDRLRLDVKVSEGTEVGSWAGASKFDSRSIVDIVETGPIGTGPFGTLMSDIFSNDGASFQYAGESSGDGVALFEYRFQVPLKSSHYLIRAGQSWTPTAYDGQIWIDSSSFEVKRLRVRTGELPPETQSCEATSSVDYQIMKVGTGDALIPHVSVLHFLLRNGSENESVTTYSNCHEFHGESTIHFEDMPETAAADAKAAEARMIPAGVTVDLALEAPIDSDIAAAGDVIEAKVRKNVYFGKHKEVAIPAGALVRGRLTLMQHRIGEDGRFEIGILLESIEINGAETPLYAKLDRSEETANTQRLARGGLLRGAHVWLPPHGQSPMVGNFVFPTSNSRHVMARGYETRWLTLPAPAAEVVR